MKNTLQFHHAALRVDKIDTAVEWYVATLGAVVCYQDDTWALLEVGKISIALVSPNQHPAHIAFACENAGEYGTLAYHRDGSASVYIEDPFGNTIELVETPPGTEC